jgi:hypothetical protein
VSLAAKRRSGRGEPGAAQQRLARRSQVAPGARRTDAATEALWRSAGSRSASHLGVCASTVCAGMPIAAFSRLPGLGSRGCRERRAGEHKSGKSPAGATFVACVPSASATVRRVSEARSMEDKRGAEGRVLVPRATQGHAQTAKRLRGGAGVRWRPSVNHKSVPSLRMWSTCRVCRLQLAREAPDPQEPRPEVQEASTQGENRAR